LGQIFSLSESQMTKLDTNGFRSEKKCKAMSKCQKLCEAKD